MYPHALLFIWWCVNSLRRVLKHHVIHWSPLMAGLASSQPVFQIQRRERSNVKYGNLYINQLVTWLFAAHFRCLPGRPLLFAWWRGVGRISWEGACRSGVMEPPTGDWRIMTGSSGAVVIVKSPNLEKNWTKLKWRDLALYLMSRTSSH